MGRSKLGRLRIGDASKLIGESPASLKRKIKEGRIDAFREKKYFYLKVQDVVNSGRIRAKAGTKFSGLSDITGTQIKEGYTLMLALDGKTTSKKREKLIYPPQEYYIVALLDDIFVAVNNRKAAQKSWFPRAKSYIVESLKEVLDAGYCMSVVS